MILVRIVSGMRKGIIGCVCLGVMGFWCRGRIYADVLRIGRLMGHLVDVRNNIDEELRVLLLMPFPLSK